MPLLLALTLNAAAAAQLSSYENVWRDARAATDRGENVLAAKMIDEALQRAGASQDQWVWELRIHRAFVFIRTGDRNAASQLLSTPLPKKLANTATAIRRLLVLAQINYRMDDDSTANALLEEAWGIADKHVPVMRPDVLYIRSNLMKSEAAAREAVRLARKNGNAYLLVRAEAALAQTLGTIGRYAEAVQIAEPLPPRMQKLGLLALRKTLLGNLGWYYSELGDYDRAAELLMGSMAEAKRMRDSQEFFWATTYSNVQLIRRDWQSATAHCEYVIRGTGKDERIRADAFSTLARAYLEQRRIDDARNAVGQALALEQDPEDKLIARIVASRIDLATREYETAAKTLLDVINTTKEPTTKLSAQGQLAQVYAVSKQNDRAQKAFDRAMALVRAARSSPGFAKDKELRLFFFNTTSELYDDYVDFLVSTNRNDDALRVIETSRAQTLAEELDLPSPENIDPRKIARQRNATILYYWLGRRRSYVWTVTPAAVTVTTLPKNDFDIEKKVEPYRNRLTTTGGTLDRIGAAGEELYKLLVAPAVQGLPRGARVIVVPDGKLHTLNFETLVVPGPKPRYWIEDVVLTNAWSLHLLARSGAPAAQQPRMLLVGNPPPAGVEFPALKYAGDEIARIEKRFPRRVVLSGTNATPAKYAAAKPESFDFVHFVAHGFSSTRRPLDSAVILGAGPEGNYRLLARDIANRALAARLVTISSCYGAGTATYAGEGLVGLAWAFLHAGAQQVVAALWAVNDTAAPKLMDQMYAGIRAGKEPDLALREAKLALLATVSPHRHPKFWAPFVIYR